MNCIYRPTCQGWAVIVLGVAVLALGGCGRKAGLDLPANAPPLAAAPVDPDSDAARAAQPSVFNPGYGADTPPATPKGTKRSFILDPLVNN